MLKAYTISLWSISATIRLKMQERFTKNVCKSKPIKRTNCYVKWGLIMNWKILLVVRNCVTRYFKSILQVKITRRVALYFSRWNFSWKLYIAIRKPSRLNQKIILLHTTIWDTFSKISKCMKRLNIIFFYLYRWIHNNF